MKSFRIIMVFFFCCAFFNGISQEKSRKQLRVEEKLAKEKEIKKLIDAKEFQFVARNSNSQSFRMIDLTLNPNFVKFKPNYIKSDMPFFGRAYSGVGYGSDNGGLKFEGEPQKFTIEERNKEYQIKVGVKGKNDFFNLTLLVSYNGSGILIINSNNRAPISYFGVIMPLKDEPKEK